MLIKKKNFSVLFLLVLGLTGVYAQGTITVSGGKGSGSGGSVSYTIGQVVYRINTGANGTSTEGVQQPYEISVVSGIENGETINLTFTTYPNPTSNFLMLKIEGEVKTQYTASLYEITGKFIESKKVESNETSIDMKNYLPAIYLLKVTDGIKEVKTFKIIKTR